MLDLLRRCGDPLTELTMSDALTHQLIDRYDPSVTVRFRYEGKIPVVTDTFVPLAEGRPKIRSMVFPGTGDSTIVRTLDGASPVACIFETVGANYLTNCDINDKKLNTDPSEMRKTAIRDEMWRKRLGIKGSFRHRSVAYDDKGNFLPPSTIILDSGLRFSFIDHHQISFPVIGTPGRRNQDKYLSEIGYAFTALSRTEALNLVNDEPKVVQINVGGRFMYLCKAWRSGDEIKVACSYKGVVPELMDKFGIGDDDFKYLVPSDDPNRTDQIYNTPKDVVYHVAEKKKVEINEILKQVVDMRIEIPDDGESIEKIEDDTMFSVDRNDDTVHLEIRSEKTGQVEEYSITRDRLLAKYSDCRARYANSLLGRLVKHVGGEDIIDENVALGLHIDTDTQEGRSMATMMYYAYTYVLEPDMVVKLASVEPDVDKYGAKAVSRFLKEVFSLKDLDRYCILNAFYEKYEYSFVMKLVKNHKFKEVVTNVMGTFGLSEQAASTILSMYVEHFPDQVKYLKEYEFRKKIVTAALPFADDKVVDEIAKMLFEFYRYGGVKEVKEFIITRCTQ